MVCSHTQTHLLTCSLTTSHTRTHTNTHNSSLPLHMFSVSVAFIAHLSLSPSSFSLNFLDSLRTMFAERCVFTRLDRVSASGKRGSPHATTGALRREGSAHSMACRVPKADLQVCVSVSSGRSGPYACVNIDAQGRNQRFGVVHLRTCTDLVRGSAWCRGPMRRPSPRALIRQ